MYSLMNINFLNLLIGNIIMIFAKKNIFPEKNF